MSFRNWRNWPPIWIGLSDVGTKQRKILQGEIGILKEVRYYTTRGNRIFLVTEHEGAQYIGCLLFDNGTMCERLAEHLRGYCGRPIEAAGASQFPLP